MIDLIIIGTIGLDDVKTPFGQVEAELGGSGSYASAAASFFSKPGLISVAGIDLPQSKINILKKCGVNLAGVERKGRNFRWTGEYEYDMNEAQTLKTELNSLVDFDPTLPQEYRTIRFVFLANADPVLQMKVIDQLENNPSATDRTKSGESNKPFIAIDTMNFWIQNKKKELLDVIRKSDLAVMNEGEARQLFDTPNLIRAGRKVLELGPTYAIIKKGEHGALLFSNDNFFSAPGYPLENVIDPTGAGDSFTGALIGYLAKINDTSETNIRKAVIYGSTIASFCAESFGLGYLKKIKKKDIEERYNAFRRIREF